MEESCTRMFRHLKLEMARRRIKKLHPYLTLSFAQSLDGCLGSTAGQSTSLSCQESLKMTHQLRAIHQSILVGIDTVLIDDPRLNVRYADGPSPLPIVLDSRLRIPLNSSLIRESADSLIIFTSNRANEKKQRQLEALGIEVYNLPIQESGLCLQHLITLLQVKGIDSVMIEGGGRIISSFLEQQLIDFMVITIAPILLGSQSAIRYQLPAIGAYLNDSHVFHLGQDMVAWGHPGWHKTDEQINTLIEDGGLSQ